jgi:hypothetical protein
VTATQARQARELPGCARAVDLCLEPMFAISILTSKSRHSTACLTRSCPIRVFAASLKLSQAEATLAAAAAAAAARHRDSPKRSEQSEQKMNNSPCSFHGQRQGAAIAGHVAWSTS